MNIETQQYLQQFFEKDAQTIKAWFEAACVAHPNPPFGYEGLKANPGFLVITFGAPSKITSLPKGRLLSMIDLLLIAALAQAPPSPEPTPPGGDRRDGISAEVLRRPSADLLPTDQTIRSNNIMSNFGDPEILKHLEDTLGTVRRGLTQARDKISGIDPNLYSLIDQAACLAAGAEREIGDRLDTMYHQGEVTER